MGNTSSNEHEVSHDLFIEEQKRIILEQQEQIERLARIAENSQQQQLSQKKKKIDPYKVLSISKNYDESMLKKAYLEKALITHPDRGGNKEEFQKVTACYKALMLKLKDDNMKHDHNELRGDSNNFMEQQMTNRYQNMEPRDLSQNFDQNMFNKIYEENRIEDVDEQGYSDWIKQNEVNEEDILYNNSLTKDNFNNEFSKQKQMYLRKKGTEIKKYVNPREDISYKGKSSIMVLGKSKTDDFSGETGSGLAYRDYKDAYTNTFLVSDELYDTKKEKTLKKFQKERENISYEMSEKDIELLALKKMKEENEEKLRIQRLQENDRVASDMYDKIHQRMIGI